MTKKSADINYVSRDLFPKTYNRTMIDDDYIKQLEKENQKHKEVIEKALDFIDCHFKEMVADEEAQELKSILKEVE